MINGILKNKINGKKFKATGKYTQKQNLYFILKQF